MEKVKPIHPIRNSQTSNTTKITNNISDSQNQPVVMSKKAIKRRLKLIQKKLSQGLKTFSNQEKKKIDDFVSEEPTTTILVLYFGNGQEEDYSALSREVSSIVPQY